MNNDNKIAVITGTGMDSKTMTHYLLSKNYKVIMTHRQNATQDIDKVRELFYDDLVKYPQASLDFVFMELTEQHSVNLAIKKILENTKFGKIDEFYNFAAQSHVGLSFSNPVYTMKATGISVFYILEAIKEYTPKTKVFQASTSEMFGGDPKRCPFNENSLFETRSPYAIAKRVAYDWVVYFRQTYNMFVCSAFGFNHSNNYRHSNFFVQKCCMGASKIALGKQKELYLGNLNFSRDESYTDFCIEAFYKMMQLDKPEDFVIGNGTTHSGEEFLYESFNYFNLNWKDYVKIDNSLIRPNEVVMLIADSKKAQKMISWIPNRISFKKHIELMCKYDYDLESGISKPVRPILI
jgi:GDPmannose 4,6-dehydratase